MNALDSTLKKIWFNESLQDISMQSHKLLESWKIFLHLQLHLDWGSNGNRCIHFDEESFVQNENIWDTYWYIFENQYLMALKETLTINI